MEFIRFKNMKIEIIILPLEKREEKNFMSFSGILSEKFDIFHYYT